MPAHRKTTVLGRGPGKDRAGRTLAERERIEHHARMAETAGLVIDEGDDWFRWGIERIFELSNPPVTRDDIDEMATIESVLQNMLAENGVPLKIMRGKTAVSIVPNRSYFCDLVWRIRQKRGEV